VNPRAVDLVREDCLAAIGDGAHLLAPLRNDTIVITGGTGFVGTWLAEMIACLNDRHQFNTRIVLVSRSADHFKATRAHLANRKDIALLKSDVRHLMELPRETAWLIHAAANPDSRHHSTNPLETMSVIGEGTSAVIRALDRCAQLKMMLNLSSALIYGSQPMELESIAESFGGAPTCSSVSSSYAEAKRYAETLCAAARSQGRIPTITARPFAFIGPYQSLDTPWAINNFIRDAMSHSPIRVFGDGQTVRSYLYPSDMAFWMLRILTAGAAGATYNIGSPEGITLMSLAERVASHFAPRPEIRLNTASNQASRSRMVPNVSLAASSLGLSQKVSLPTAIERTIQWNKWVWN